MKQGSVLNFYALLAVSALLVFCIFPLGVSVEKTFHIPPDQTFLFYWYEQILKIKSVARAAYNTLLVSLLVGLTSVLFAVPLGWIVARTDLPFARFFKSAFCLPFAIPPYIGAMAWIFLANPTTGVLNFFFPHSVFNIYSLIGLVFVESTFMFSIVFLNVVSVLSRMDPTFEESARVSGAGYWRVFKDITLPLIFPTIASSFVLVALATAASFGIPALIGSPARILLLTTQIYTLQKMGTLKGMYEAIALSVLLLVGTGLLLFCNQVISARQVPLISGRASRATLINLGSNKFLITLFASFVVFVILILPTLGIGMAAFSKVQGVFHIGNFGLENFGRVLFHTHETSRALSNSFSFALTAGLLSCVIGFVLAFLTFRNRKALSRWINTLAGIPYSTPGTVLALSFILAFSRGIFGLGPALYGTSALIIIAYMAKYLSFSLTTCQQGFRQIDPVLEEAARVSGATPFIALKTIWVPLLLPAIAASFFLVFLPALSELTMTILLAGPGQETIGTLIFQMQEYGDTTSGGAAVLALVILVCVVFINLIVKKVSDGRFGL